MKYAVLVYQAGIANVFEVSSTQLTNRKRLMQGDFRSCEAFARGIKAAGVKVSTWACNQAGDITDSEWSNDLESQPFSDKFNPVFS